MDGLRITTLLIVMSIVQRIQNLKITIIYEATFEQQIKTARGLMKPSYVLNTIKSTDVNNLQNITKVDMIKSDIILLFTKEDELINHLIAQQNSIMVLNNGLSLLNMVGRCGQRY